MAELLTRSLAGEPGWCLRSYVLDREEFNALRIRLPRAVRRDVEVVPQGHVGLIAQAVVDDEPPLAVLYGSAPASAAAEGQRLLECKLTALMA
jgi:hypothetical protein